VKKIIRTESAPAAVGPYSQAVEVPAGRLLFCSGQIPLDPKTQELVGGTAAEQCRQVMENIKAILIEAGTELSQVVKTTLYLSDMADFPAVNEVYSEYFDSDPPARACLEAASLPKGAKLEIDAIAVV